MSRVRSKNTRNMFSSLSTNVFLIIIDNGYKGKANEACVS